MKDNKVFLQEAAGSLAAQSKSKARFLIKAIQPGWGSSGYYSKDLLETSAKAFEGVHMYWDHPTSSEAYERPERSLRDLAAVLNNVSYQEDGQDGPGIYGVADVFEHYVQPLKEMAEYIGVSIRATGIGRPGEVDGREGTVVEGIDQILSVDFVTKPGAGGKVLKAFREAAESNSIKDNDDKALLIEGQVTELIEKRKEEEAMELKEALEEIKSKDKVISEQEKTIESKDAALQEAVKEKADLEKQLKESQDAFARLQEATLISQAKAIINDAVDATELIEATKVRIKESLEGFVPVKDGALDEPALTAKIQEAIKVETDYLKQFASVGVTGMGRALGAKQQSLEEAFAGLGLSESAIKIAANGR